MIFVRPHSVTAFYNSRYSSSSLDSSCNVIYYIIFDWSRLVVVGCTAGIPSRTPQPSPCHTKCSLSRSRCAFTDMGFTRQRISTGLWSWHWRLYAISVAAHIFLVWWVAMNVRDWCAIVKYCYFKCSSTWRIVQGGLIDVEKLFILYTC